MSVNMTCSMYISDAMHTTRQQLGPTFRAIDEAEDRAIALGETSREAVISRLATKISMIDAVIYSTDAPLYHLYDVRESFARMRREIEATA